MPLWICLEFLLLFHRTCTEVNDPMGVHDDILHDSGNDTDEIPFVVHGNRTLVQDGQSDGEIIEDESEHLVLGSYKLFDDSFLDTEGFHDKTENKPAVLVGKSRLLKKMVDCKTKDCMEVSQNNTKAKTFIKRYKPTKTPLRSYNFLASVAPILPVTKEKQFRKQLISIFQPDDKSKNISSDWPKGYDLEAVNPDYKIQDEYFQKHVNGPTTLSSRYRSTSSVLNTIVESASIYGRDGISKLSTLKYVKTKPSFTKKLYKSLNQKVQKYLKTKRPLPILIPAFGIKQIIEDDAYISNHALHPGNDKRKASILNEDERLNSSYEFSPYPVYVTGKQIVPEEKLAIPFPYFVLRPNKGKIPLTFNSKKEEQAKNETWLDKYLESFYIENDPVGIHSGDDYMGLENDDDYEPSTQEDDYPIISLPTAYTVETESTYTADTTNKSTDVTVTWPYSNIPLSPTTGNASRQPNPYLNGTIYSYYDCADMDSATRPSDSLLIIPLFCFLINTYGVINVFY